MAFMMTRFTAWNELVAVLVLGVFLCLASLVVWFEWNGPPEWSRAELLALQKRSSGASHNPRDQLLPEVGRNWNASFEYKSTDGSLFISLDKAIGEQPGELSVSVWLEPHDRSSPAHSTTLEKLPDGRFHAGGVGLKKGSWTMQLTGRRNSRFEFWMEHVIKVD